MSLRFKLPLFTAIFVILAAIAVLGISIYQINDKKKKDIQAVHSMSERPGSVKELLAFRIQEIQSDTSAIIRDRLIFFFIIIIIWMLVIFIFSKRITDPINQLVSLSEEITLGRKDYSERIQIRSHDEIGRLSKSFNTLLGYTEQSLKKARENAEKYKELIENANSAIIRIDILGVVLFFNEYAQRLFGFAPEDVMGKPMYETFGKAVVPDAPPKSIFKRMKNETYVEVEHRTSKGHYLWVGWTNRPILDENNNLKEFLCVGSDITQRKDAEKYAAMEQRKLIHTDKMATLGVLVSGVAHEINNPNNFIILNSQNLAELWNEIRPVLDKYSAGYPDFALGGQPYQEMKKDIAVLIQGLTDGARRIKRIVDTLKDFSRQDPDDAGQVLAIPSVIEAAELITSNLIKKTTNQFTKEIPRDLPPVRGSFQRLEQVIINLITNACQATDSAEKPITVTVSHNAADRQVSIAISDRGAGITPENMQSIFNPFFTTKREVGGTGLGLAIAYSIVKDHGGELKIASKIGEGTTATMNLPVAS